MYDMVKPYLWALYVQCMRKMCRPARSHQTSHLTGAYSSARLSLWELVAGGLSGDGFDLLASFDFGSVPRQTQRQPRVARRSHAARYGCACLRSLEWRHAHGRTVQLASSSPAAPSRRAWTHTVAAWARRAAAWVLGSQPGC